MLANSVMLNVMHPGRLLPRDSTVYLGLDGVTELKGPGWRDPRRWWWQVVDPFDLGSCRRRDPKFDFWNHLEVVEGERDGVVVESEAGEVAEVGEGVEMKGSR
jgi:hypothetical protein